MTEFCTAAFNQFNVSEGPRAHFFGFMLLVICTFDVLCGCPWFPCLQVCVWVCVWVCLVGQASSEELLRSVVQLFLTLDRFVRLPLVSQLEVSELEFGY